MTDFLLAILYASLPFAAILLGCCVAGSLADRDYDRLTSRNDGAKRGREVVRAAWRLNGKLFL